MLLITREADYALRILRTLSEGGTGYGRRDHTAGADSPAVWPIRFCASSRRSGSSPSTGESKAVPPYSRPSGKIPLRFDGRTGSGRTGQRLYGAGLSMLLAAKLRQRLQNPQPAGGNPSSRWTRSCAGTVLRRSFPVGEGGVGRYFFFQSG